MDTIEQQAPVGSDGATSSPDTAQEVDTQTFAPDTTVSDGATGPAEENASEPLLAGKYKTQEDLVEAYKNLEGKLGDLGQKAAVADLIQETYNISPEQLRRQVEQLESQKRQERYANDPLAPLVDEVASLRAKVEAQEAEKANALLERDLDSFVRENPAYASSREKILKLARTPGIGFDPKTGEDLAGVADIAREWIGTTIAQGQQDAYKKIDTKEKTQATGASQSAPKGKLTLDDLSQMSTKELEAALPWAQPK